MCIKILGKRFARRIATICPTEGASFPAYLHPKTNHKRTTAMINIYKQKESDTKSGTRICIFMHLSTGGAQQAAYTIHKITEFPIYPLNEKGQTNHFCI